MENKEYHVLGVMSGTSLDGIDIAELKFSKQAYWKYEILKAETIPYPAQWVQKLAGAIHHDEDNLRKLNYEYTIYLGRVIHEFLQGNHIVSLDAVCSHGHTIKHRPEEGYTLQIGNMAPLADLLKQMLVCDFRVQDVKMGGQGAPLVPIGDRLLFGDFDSCLNLGGFANISSESDGKRLAYDICAVNTVMNYLAGKKGLEFDKDGSLAASGELDMELLNQLDALEFYSLPAPKSLGMEWVNKELMPLIRRKKDISSVLHTYVVHIAQKIASCFDGQASTKVLVTGGGAFNSFLMEQIRKHTRCEIVVPAPELVNYKEALVFGLLGVLKLRREVNVLSSVTGASEDHSSGNIFKPWKVKVQEMPQ